MVSIIPTESLKVVDKMLAVIGWASVMSQKIVAGRIISGFD